MKRNRGILFAIVGAFLATAGIAAAQTANPISPWIYGTGAAIRTQLSSSTVSIPQLPNAPCIKTNASGTLQSTTCGSAGSSTTTINGVAGPTFTFNATSSGNTLAISTSTGSVLITIPQNVGFFTNNAGYITLTSLSGTTPIGYSTSTGAISITKASSTADGYLSSTDWSTFNGKQATLTIGNLTPASSSRLTVSGGTGAVIGSGATLDLATTSVTAGSYTLTSLTVDAYGRITAASSGSASGGITSLNGLTTSTQTFATSTATSSFKFVSSGSTHTLTIPSNVGFFSNDSNYASQSYVDAAVNGTDYKAASKYATTAVLPTVVYNNGASGVGATLTAVGVGALSLDGSSPSVGDRLLVKNQVDQTQNGIYTVTASGGGAAVFVLTRSTDFDQSSDINAGDATYIVSGTANGGSTWVMVTAGTITVGSSNIVWSQIAGPGSILAGTGISVSGLTVSNTGVLSIAGTANQVIASNSTGTITLSLPQSIGTASAVTFGGLTVNGAATTTGTSTLATSTITSLKIGSLSGFLKGSSGTVSATSSVSLTADVNGILAETSGGTNQSTYTKGDLLYASAANTLSKLNVGATGTVLLASSTGLPAWTATSSLGITSASTASGTEQVFLSTGSSSTYTAPAGLKWAFVEIQSAGGGGSSTNANGGGGGCYARKIFSAAAIGATTSVFVSAGGAAATAAASSSFGTFVVPGGAAGASGATVSCNSLQGDFNINGQQSTTGFTAGTTNVGGGGGLAFMGFGANLVTHGSGSAGAAAGINCTQGYGGGGGSIASGSSGSASGGTGCNGAIIVREYY